MFVRPLCTATSKSSHWKDFPSSNCCSRLVASCQKHWRHSQNVHTCFKRRKMRYFSGLCFFREALQVLPPSSAGRSVLLARQADFSLFCSWHNKFLRLISVLADQAVFVSSLQLSSFSADSIVSHYRLRLKYTSMLKHAYADTGKSTSHLRLAI